MICDSCGAKNLEDAKFCNSCGESLNNDATKSLSVEDSGAVPGQFIIDNRFKVLDKIGSGGMGAILLAEDVKLKRKVAVKSILTKALSDPTSKARFLREAQTASQLDHTNICTIYEIYEEDDKDYIVMQYIDGITLNQIINIEKLSIGKVLDIAIQLCDGMIEANSKKIIHRDIKPANIMIDKKGIIKILDFGLAKFRDKSIVKQNGMVDSNLTERGIVMGTVAYISPEQARGQALDQRTDIFSFGVVLYEMLEGVNPFTEDEQIATLFNVINKEIEFNREIPADLKKILFKSLEKDIDKRYADFSQLKADLEEFRFQYNRLRRGLPPGGRTEKIDHQKHERLIKDIRKATDKEDLGDIVYRIKRFKAYTEPMPPTGRKKLKYIILPAALLLIAVLFYVFFIKAKAPALITPEDNFYIYMHNFEDETGQKEKGIEEKLNYLLKESLNQFERFKIIDINAVPASSRSNAEKTKEAFALLNEKFDIAFELSGTITKDGTFFDIDSQLTYFKTGEGKSGKKRKFKESITSTGEGPDTFLESQVKTVTDRVCGILFPEEKGARDIKEMKEIYGADWGKFSAIYTGHKHLKMLEFSSAERYLLRAEDTPMAKYLLAETYALWGDRARAKEKLKEAENHNDKLTEPLLLRARALRARLEYDLQAEVKNRQALIDCFPFSKEAYFNMGEAYFQHRAPGGAIDYYQKALTLDKNYSRAINHLAYCYSFTGDHVNAIKYFEKYKDLDKTANSFDSLGDGYFYKGELLSAEQFKQRAVKKDENNVPYSYSALADIFILKAEYEKARDALDNYYRVKKDDQSGAIINATKAFILYQNRQYAEALKFAEESLQILTSDDITNDTGEAHWIKGLILLKLNKLEESKKVLSWLREFKDKYKLTVENFADSYKFFLHLRAAIDEREGRFDEAEAGLKSVIEIKEKLSFYTYFHYQFFHTEYAAFLSRRNKHSDALDELDTCLEFNRDYIPALWLKAEISEKVKNVNRKDIGAIYEKIKELYGESGEKNYLRTILSKKIK